MTTMSRPAVSARVGNGSRGVVVPMMCQRCKNEATVHLTEPGKGKRRELHLCAACAPQGGLALAGNRRRAWHWMPWFRA